MVSSYFFPGYHPSFYPQEIVLELTNHCNLACVMCPHQKMQRKQGKMEEELYCKIIDEIAPRTELVYLYGTGESLLHKDLYRFNKYAKSKGLATCVSTNGQLMDESASESLLSCGLDFLIIALDGGVKETYESIRINGDFNKLISNIKTLLQMQNKIKSKTTITLQMIYMVENLQEMHLFRSLFTTEEKKAVSQFRFKPMYSYTLGDKRIAHKHPCFWLWNMMSVHWNGDVALCCTDFDGKIKLGNVQNQSIAEVWHSAESWRIRERHKNLNYDDMPVCNQCDVPDQGYFTNFTIFSSLFLDASKIRKIMPFYEKFFLLSTSKEVIS